MTELVLNHTSDQHKWFQRASQAKPGTKARDFYVWSDTPENTRRPGSSSRTSSLQLDLGPGGQRLLTGTASTPTSPT